MRGGTAYVGFGCTELELDETDLGLFYPCGATDGCNNVLVEDNAFYEFGILDRAANLLDYSDITKVDIRGGWGYKSGHCRDGDGGEG